MKACPFFTVQWIYIATLPVLTLAAAGLGEAKPPELGLDASLHGKAVFPAGSLWNRDVSNDPVDPKSAEILGAIGLRKPLHPDFGTVWNGAPMGIPYFIVAGNQPKVPIAFTDYGDESDAGPYPVPPDAQVEGGAKSDGDRHVLVIDRDRWILYELYRAFPIDNGKRWKAGCGAIWDLKINARRPVGWTSADAAGLPIFPGLARYDEVIEQGRIGHALRFTVQKTRRQFIPPATHFASRSNDARLPPMGLRVRLKSSFDIGKFPKSAQVILKCLQTHGMILADNGGDFFISGAPDPRWNDEELNTLKRVHASDLEVVAVPAEKSK